MFHIHCFAAGGGVGTPLVEQQSQFDYQMAFPIDWSIQKNNLSGNWDQKETWIASNKSIVGEALKTSIEVRFYEKFPASDISELYYAVSKNHPNFKFTNNPNQYIQGWTSALIQTDDYYENYEFYFVSPGKIVEVYTKRRGAGYGLSHTEIILQTIRKISDGPMVKSIKILNSIDIDLMPGSKLCYEIVIDYPKEFQTKEMISSFKINYDERNLKSAVTNSGIIKERTYKKNTGKHNICYDLHHGMIGSDYKLKTFSFSYNGEDSEKECEAIGNKVTCNESEFTLHYPNFINRDPVILGPELIDMVYDENENVIKFVLDDYKKVDRIMIIGQNNINNENLSIAQAFKDEITSNEIKLKFSKNIPPTTYIHGIYFIGKYNNASALVRNGSDLKYSYKQINKKIKKTQFRVIGW